jgi:ribosomal protein S18 acetylase RimI-like enzyme
MTSGDKFSLDQLSIRKGILDDIPAMKQLADHHKRELGFIVQGALRTSVNKSELFVATLNNALCGFVQYRHRLDHQTTLYNIVVDAKYRERGIGRELVKALINEAFARKKLIVLLKCPTDLPANSFYSRCGFILDRVEPGKSRSLNIWKYVISPQITDAEV